MKRLIFGVILSTLLASCVDSTGYYNECLEGRDNIHEGRATCAFATMGHGLEEFFTGNAW